MVKHRIFAKTGALMVLLGLLPVACTSAGDNPSKEASAEMEFGYKAASRGYWQEALWRFDQANELTPDQPRILNNLAVAQEANGLYEQALLTYQHGLAIEPANKALKRNYARFQEFYTSFIAPPEDDGQEGGDGDQGAENARESR